MANIRANGKARTPLDKVFEFYRATGKPVRQRSDGKLGPAEHGQIVSLLNEEVAELRQSIANADHVKIADALADITYVVYGAALQYGVDLDRVLELVHDANMTKVDQQNVDHLDSAGKVVRGTNYVAPDAAVIADILAAGLPDGLEADT